MTKHKHTPGPWDVEHDTEIIAAEGQRIAEADTRSINFVNGEATANAHLIAAAPDLLAALERQLDEHKRTWLTARAEVEGEGVSACLFEAEPATIAARAAIKKARGGT